jgi:uracil phosphoribosyltransferase
MKSVTVVNHPLVQHKLTFMRKKETSTAGFRRLLREISLLLCYEVTRELPMTKETIETPLAEMQAPGSGRKEAGLRLGAARRQRPSRRHA